MTLLVTGSVAVDTVKTPFGYSEKCVGGSAVYFSLSAGCFTPVRFLGVVGEDFPFDLSEVFKEREVDLAGLEVRKGSKTFRWVGSYEGDMDEAKTDNVELNVLSESPPAVPESFSDSKYVFLANTSPVLQMELLDQMSSPSLVAADTMNHWIVTATDELKKLLERIDLFVLNDGEARLLTGHQNLVTAGKSILEMGPETVIIKKGQHGATMLTDKGECFIVPAYPTAVVIDPTGAGDSFAGAMMGYIASEGRVDSKILRDAMVYGTVAASFVIGDFSIHGIKSVQRDDIEERVDALRKVTNF